MSLGYSYSLYIRTTRSCIINALLRLQISEMFKNLSNLHFHLLCLMFWLPRFRLLLGDDNGSFEECQHLKPLHFSADLRA